MTFAPQPSSPPQSSAAGDGGVRIACLLIGLVALVITFVVALGTDENSASSAAAPPGAPGIATNGSAGTADSGSSGDSANGSSGPNAQIGTVPADDVDNPVTTGKQLLARLPLPGDAVEKGRQRNTAGTNSLIVNWSVGGSLKDAVEYYRARIPGLGLTWEMGASGRTSKVADEYYGQLRVGRTGSQLLGSLNLNNKRYTYAGGSVPRGKVSLELIVNDASR